MVTATLPPFAKPGQVVDVNVAALGTATSLRGGNLIMTELRGIDGQTYALAQGPLTVTGITEEQERYKCADRHTDVRKGARWGYS